MMNPCIITSNNATQKFILFNSIPSGNRLTGINSLLLVFVGQLLWDPSGSGRHFEKISDGRINKDGLQMAANVREYVLEEPLSGKGYLS